MRLKLPRAARTAKLRLSCEPWLQSCKNSDGAAQAAARGGKAQQRGSRHISARVSWPEVRGNVRTQATPAGRTRGGRRGARARAIHVNRALATAVTPDELERQCACQRASLARLG